MGEDSAYGGAGAWWTRATRQLVAYDRESIVKVRVNVAASAIARRERRRGALAKRAVESWRRA